MNPASVRAPRALLSLALLITVAAPASAQRERDFFNERTKEAIRFQTGAEDQDYLIDLGSRLVLPGMDTDITFDGGRAVVYLQFDEPLTEAERSAAIRLGVRFFGPLNRYTHLARIKESTLDNLTAFPKLRGVEPALYADRLDEKLYRGKFSEHATNDDGSFTSVVRFYGDVSLPHALSTLDSLGIAPFDRTRMLFADRMFVKSTWEGLLALSERPVVQWIREIPPPPQVDNITSQAISNVDDVQIAPHNLSGAGVQLGIWDEAAVRANHPDLTGRVNNVEGGTPGDHSTHVAGTMMGNGTNNANAEGMAPGAPMIHSWNFGGDPPTEMYDGVMNQNIVISNNSWGTGVGWNDAGDDFNDNQGLFGQYSVTTETWDYLVCATDLIICKSSGNDRNDQDMNDPSDHDGALGPDGQYYDTIPHRGVAKNIITVGAVDDGSNISGFSSSGPADDGRIKPDIVANGVGLTSTWAGGTTIPGGCDGLDYCSIGGTSMSTPTVSGICALLVEKYRQIYFGVTPDPATVKAVLVNNAMDLGRVGPDYLYGHGLADALAAVETIHVGPVRIVNNSVGQGAEDEYLLIVPGGTTVMDATLVWTDCPPPIEELLGGNVINDIDLELISPSNSIFYPWTGPGTGNPTGNATATAANTIDNVEHATINNPEQGIWRVRVRGTGVADGSQDYALVTSQSMALEDQPNIVINAPLNFFEICEGDFQDIEVSIFNTGGAPLFVHDVAVTAGLADFTLLQPPVPPFIVQSGSHVDVTVRFSPSSPGVKNGLLHIFTNDPDEPFIDVPMTGTGGVQDLRTSLEAHGNFGCVKLGEFRTLEYQIINQGTCDLTVTSLTRTAGSVEFTLGEQPGSALFPLTIFPGEHVQVFFKYEPVDFTFDTSSWTLVTDDPDTAERTFQLQGRSMPPDIAVTGSTDFGVVCADELAEKILDICNVGKSDLQVTSVDFVAPCDDFTLINSPYPPAVADDFTPVSHDFCLPVTIRYTPTGAGEHSCVLRIESNDPDEPTVDVTVTGETPPSLIDVPDDLEFPPTVVQAIDETCQSSFPFAVTNIGVCDVQIVDIAIEPPAGGDPNYTDYTLENLPEFPLTLQPGHRVGNGQAIVVFRPTAVKRFIKARVAVTYVSNDPEVGDTTTVYVQLCGEGVNTGARLLVTKNGVPIPHVDKITLWAIDDYGEPTQSSYVIEVVLDVWVQQVLDDPPCTGFFFHHEWGGETNPIVLAPGWYRVESAVGTESPPDRTTVFYIPDVCTFLPDVVIDYP